MVNGVPSVSLTIHLASCNVVWGTNVRQRNDGTGSIVIGRTLGKLSPAGKKMAEESRITIRNERRDAMKHIDTMVKDKSNAFSEDDGKQHKAEVESLTKSHIASIDSKCEEKSKEIQTIFEQKYL